MECAIARASKVSLTTTHQSDAHEREVVPQKALEWSGPTKYEPRYVSASSLERVAHALEHRLHNLGHHGGEGRKHEDDADEDEEERERLRSPPVAR